MAGEEPVQDASFARTRAELVEAFDGVTAYLRSPAQGLWTAPDGSGEREVLPPSTVGLSIVTPGHSNICHSIPSDQFHNP